jgi:hypothetical protein
MPRATAWLRAIIIDPKKREVRQERIENSLEAMQKVVGGDIQVVPMLCLGDDEIYCDEEGKVKLFDESYEPGAFIMRTREHDPFVGTCFILGPPDSDGQVTETGWSPEEIQEFVTWL